MASGEPTDITNQASPPPEVVIFGSGACALKIAANLSENGIDAWLATAETPPAAAGRHVPMHWLAGSELTRCRGFAGKFELTLTQNQAIRHLTVPAIVLAEDDHRFPNYFPYGLEPGSRVMAISSLEDKLRQAPVKDLFESGARIVFLCGWQNDSHPAIARRMLAGCLRLQRRGGVSTYFVTGNLKVSANGAEETAQAAKRAGALFFKFTGKFPIVRMLADGRFEIDYLDELTRTPFQFRADWIVVDEAVGPCQRMDSLAQRLGIEKDGSGFAQGDNVRRWSNATNRNGIFVAGGSRGILSREEQLADADQVTLNVLDFLQRLDVDDLPAVAIHSGRCARCLTCHRLCPHKAIEIGPHMSVASSACQRCGICMAGCPARAIEMEGVQVGTEIDRRLQKHAVKENRSGTPPQVMVLGCSRSAGRALALTRLMGLPPARGVQFIEVPCGGAISGRHLLAAFEAGVKGVMLCTCHTGNCQSETGNRVARKRVGSARDLLTAAGMESDRLHVATVAANMGSELAFMVEAFVDRIHALEGS